MHKRSSVSERGGGTANEAEAAKEEEEEVSGANAKGADAPPEGGEKAKEGEEDSGANASGTEAKDAQSDRMGLPQSPEMYAARLRLIAESMPTPTATWLSPELVDSLDWTGWHKISARRFPDIWLQTDTTVRMRHHEAGWFEAKAGAREPSPEEVVAAMRACRNNESSASSGDDALQAMRDLQSELTAIKETDDVAIDEAKEAHETEAKKANETEAKEDHQTEAKEAHETEAKEANETVAKEHHEIEAKEANETEAKEANETEAMDWNLIGDHSQTLSQ